MKTIAAALGMQIAPYLAHVISSGTLSSKLVTASCFAGLEECDASTMPLIHSYILERGGNFDAERLAIEALGYLGTHG